LNSRFTLIILAALVLGGVAGALIHANVPAAQAAEFAGYISILTDIFLRLIKMIIAPLVFCTLVAGIAHMGDGKAIGRIGAKTMGWFLTASLVSLTIGMVMVTLLHPGTTLSLPVPPTTASSGVASDLSLKEFIAHVFPTSLIDAMARNEILQIVVFSLFAGIAIAALGARAARLLDIIEEGSSVMLRITDYVMKFAPVAVFAAVCSTVATQGLGIITTYAAFVGGFYLSLFILWGLLFLAGVVVLGRRGLGIPRMVRDPALLAFSTASSESAYPRTLEKLEAFGVPKRIASFVLPLGYSFNLDGSMMYTTFASLFIAQVYGIHLTLGQHITMVAILMLTSKGIAGVPRASLVVIAATLAFFHIPEAGLLLILGVDHFLDMGRSATNVIGNSVAAVAVAKWEGVLAAETDDPEAAPA
jgi:Na+/H+-dicarboxylate symporter